MPRIPIRRRHVTVVCDEDIRDFDLRSQLRERVEKARGRDHVGIREIRRRDEDAVPRLDLGAGAE
jgi:hypothetical protein